MESKMRWPLGLDKVSMEEYGDFRSASSYKIQPACDHTRVHFRRWGGQRPHRGNSRAGSMHVANAGVLGVASRSFPQP